ncbi:MAG: hypothetical protein JST00_27285 [Deltaproteobacteria bacterium]|nr:hypothetical protein [Deltaproteobacteria bacterium]
MSAPHVEAEAPASWAAAEIAQPPLAQGSGARFSQWEVRRSPGGEHTLVRACVETPIPGWVEDMKTAVEARGQGVAMATAERTSGAPAERRDEGEWSSLRAMGAPASSPPMGALRTFLAFDDQEVATCFAVCTSTRAAEGAGAEFASPCASVVAAARVIGGTPPPPPGLLIGASHWAVHHPTHAAAGAGLAVFVLGLLAVVLRRKPRSRIQ